MQVRAAELDGQTVADPSGAILRWFGVAKSAEADACQTWLTEVNLAATKAPTAFLPMKTGRRPSGWRS